MNDYRKRRGFQKKSALAALASLVGTKVMFTEKIPVHVTPLALLDNPMAGKDPGMTVLSGAEAPTNIPLADTLKYEPYFGLVVENNPVLILANCSACRSTELIRDNRFIRDGWLPKIRWMQRSKICGIRVNLNMPFWIICRDTIHRRGLNEYARVRREPLINIQWYNY